MAIPTHPLALLVVVLVVLIRRVNKKLAVPLPPGPKPLPFVGNLHQFPTKNAWVTFTKWQQEYGDIVYANVLGNRMLILNSRQACTELFEKRSAIYSDRPQVVMIKELMGFDWAFSLFPYSQRWRQHRRLFHQYFNENACKKYLHVQERCTGAFLLRLLNDRSKFLEHTRRLFGELVLHIVYGIEVKSKDDQHLDIIEKTMDSVSEALIPGRYLVDLLPALKYIPAWVPGAGFQTDAAIARKLGKEAVELPALYALKNAERADGPPPADMFTLMLEKSKKESSEGHKTVDSPLEMAKWISSVTYVTGSDTTVATIQTFFLVIANHPQVQRMAQAELDAVVGAGRLPTSDDMQDLPYINAIVKELLRYRPVTPLGVAHGVTEDDVFEGYLIPKGTIILPNIWSILHDPKVYPNPSVFDPLRWLVKLSGGQYKLNATIPDPYVAFGFGRRVCPGRHFAMSSLLLAIASVLACFDVSPLDEFGKPCEQLVEQFMDGIIIHPVPFKVSITPRSDMVVRLLKGLELRM